MRVHPILDWSYADVWDFLRHPTLSLGGGALEWCELYDYGWVLQESHLAISPRAHERCSYTSLGSTFNTFPNPQLRAENDSRAPRGWLPAWQLTDDSLERAGRCVPSALRFDEAITAYMGRDDAERVSRRHQHRQTHAF